MSSLKGHKNAVRCACIASVAALALIAGLSLAGVLNEAQATVTTAECVTEFNDSPASSTCEVETVSASGNDCTFSATCQHSGTWHDSSITVNIGDADELVNCSGSLATSC